MSKPRGQKPPQPFHCGLLTPGHQSGHSGGFFYGSMNMTELVISIITAYLLIGWGQLISELDPNQLDPPV